MNSSDNQSHPRQARANHLISTLSRYRLLWITPAILGALFSVLYVTVLRQESWSARQSLIVRDDMLGQSYKPGRFDSIESMKSAQETILEIARKPQVIRNALEQLGPEPGGLFGNIGMGEAPGPWPSEEMIEDVQGTVSFHAPNGAEFGKTEVIVLSTKASSRERSREFIELLLDEIILKVDEVRTLRLQSMEEELTQAYNAAVSALETSSAKLQEMDQVLGTDFASSATPGDAPAGSLSIKQEISQILLEKRQAQSQLAQLRSSLQELNRAQQDPGRIVSISADLIALHPALDDLKTELSKTQRELAVIAGMYEPIHPIRANAENAITEMRQQIFLELQPCVASLENAIEVQRARMQRLDEEKLGLDQRLVNLGANRADNLNLLNEWKNRAEIVSDAKRELSEIQGLANATGAELITRVDEPQVSTRPDQMGKKATVLAGGLGGLMLGLGLVMLIAPPSDDREQSVVESHVEEALDHPIRRSAEHFFESPKFEKVIVSAATAASSAWQSSTANRPVSAPRSEPVPSSREKSSEPWTMSSGPISSFSAMPELDPPVSAGTPSVHDLLDAAKEIESPASPAFQPLAFSESRDPKPTIDAIQKVKDFTDRSATKAESQTPPPQPIDRRPIRSEKTAVPQVQKSASPDLTAIQMAALSGTRVTPTEPASGSTQKPAAPATPRTAAKTRPAVPTEPYVPGRSKKASQQPPSSPSSSTASGPTQKPAPPATPRTAAKTRPAVPTEPFVPGRSSKSSQSPTASRPTEKTTPLRPATKTRPAAPTKPVKPNPTLDRSPPIAKPPATARDSDPSTVLANLSTPNEPETTSKNPGVTSNNPMDDRASKLTRREPNVRPVDLAKSVAKNESTFQRANVPDNKQGTKTSRKNPNSEQQESPGSKPTEKSGSTSPAVQSKVNPPQADVQTQADRGLTNRGDKPNPEDIPPLAVPEQIRRLSETIAKFANPPESDPPEPPDAKS